MQWGEVQKRLKWLIPGQPVLWVDNLLPCYPWSQKYIPWPRAKYWYMDNGSSVLKTLDCLSDELIKHSLFHSTLLDFESTKHDPGRIVINGSCVLKILVCVSDKWIMISKTQISTYFTLLHFDIPFEEGQHKETCIPKHYQAHKYHPNTSPCTQ